MYFTYSFLLNIEFLYSLLGWFKISYEVHTKAKTNKNDSNWMYLFLSLL